MRWKKAAQEQLKKTLKSLSRSEWMDRRGLSSSTPGRSAPVRLFMYLFILHVVIENIHMRKPRIIEAFYGDVLRQGETE